MKITVRFLLICGLLVLSACTTAQIGAFAHNRPAVSQGSLTESQPRVLKTSPARTLQFIEFYSPL